MKGREGRGRERRRKKGMYVEQGVVHQIKDVLPQIISFVLAFGSFVRLAWIDAFEDAQLSVNQEIIRETKRCHET